MVGVCWSGVRTVLGGFLLHLSLGTFYCFGNMDTYITSYLRTHVPGQVSLSRGLHLTASLSGVLRS